ncbi:MAG: hypothetical protein FWG85_03070 [Bacteroidetes bacterium]|nr:hypothetical protein [Bacteroidota bacterium]
MKKIIFFAIIILTQTVNAQIGPFGGGDGYSEATAYEIYTKEHLEELSDSVANNPLDIDDIGSHWSKDKYFKLMNNITEPLTEPIGKMFGFPSNDIMFNGFFDGQNHSIELLIDSDVGIGCLFVSIGNYAVIKNVILNGYIRGGWVAGMVCTQTDCSALDTNYVTEISNCINNAKIVGGGGYTAGFIGAIVYGTIKNCINLGSIIGRGDTGIEYFECVGGIAGMVTPPYCQYYNKTGYSMKIIIENCINYGFIKARDYYLSIYYKSYAGGIVGRNYGADPLFDYTIENCINTGVIEGPEDYSDGIIGEK